MNSLLTIEGLTVRFHLRDAVVKAVTNLNLTVRPGELVAVVGESGCGKSVLAHALLGLLPANAAVTGRALLAINTSSPNVPRPYDTTRSRLTTGVDRVDGVDSVDDADGVDRLAAFDPVDPFIAVSAPVDPVVAVDRVDRVDRVDQVGQVDEVDEVDEVGQVDRVDAAVNVDPVDGGRVDGGYRFGRGDAGGHDSIDLLDCGEKTLAGVVRGRGIGLIPQSPATALTPVRTGRRLLDETLRAHGRDRRLADQVAREAGLDPADLERYPFELSGGMAQRLATALALATEPPLLIADEPTSGLDRPLVHHTLDLLRRRCDDGAAVLLITHDLAAAERVADTVAVMYAGRIVEHRAADELFRAPGHPYSRGLLNALPSREFRAIPGHPPMLTALPEGCAFAPRCERVSEACVTQPSGPVACHHPLTTAEVPL